MAQNKNSKQANSKQLLKHCMDQMSQLSTGGIDVEEAKAHAGLVRQAHNILTYELQRAATVAKYGKLLRNIEEA